MVIYKNICTESYSGSIRIASATSTDLRRAYLKASLPFLMIEPLSSACRAAGTELPMTAFS